VNVREIDVWVTFSEILKEKPGIRGRADPMVPMGTHLGEDIYDTDVSAAYG
jgi:hypothetical protein